MRVGLQYGFYKGESTRDEYDIMMYFAKYLKQGGVEVETLSGAESDFDRFDLIHLFGLSEQTHAASRLAASEGKPVIVTPLYWNEEFPVFYDLKSLDKADGKEEPSLKEKKLTAFYYRKKMLSDRLRQQKFILENAALVISSGKCESLQLRRDYDILKGRIVELPIGIDLFLGVGKPEPFREEYGDDEFCLCVGPLSPRKNQHLLIDITRDLDIPLVLIGASDGDQEYSTHCRDIAHDRVTFIDKLDHAMLKSAYKAARFFVLPSNFELPGMAYMTAALCELPIVATNRGATWSYLGNSVTYCDPEDITSIFDAVMNCRDAEPDPLLKKHLLDNFSWGRTTIVLVKLYQKIIQVFQRNSNTV